MYKRHLKREIESTAGAETNSECGSDFGIACRHCTTFLVKNANVLRNDEQNL